MIFWAKYNTQTTFSFPMVKRGVVDLAVSADWTPAAADSAISKDQAAFADTTNTVAAVGGSPTRTATGWKITLTATELSAAQVDLQIVDAATKAVEDQFITIYTYGNASAKVVQDWSDAVRMGLTGLANATPGAAGGLLIAGTNVATTFNGVAASGATPATAGLTISGGAASTTGGGVASAAIVVTGGAGAASTNGAASGATFAGGGTNTVASTADGIKVTGTSTGHGLDAQSGAGATGNGINSVSNATNGSGITLTKAGSGSDLNASSTPLILAKTTNITGLNDIAATAVVSAGAITTSGGAVTTVTTATAVTTVNGLANNVITAASINADAITAAKIADGAIDRATFAADTGLQTIRSNTAASGAATTITLDASASGTDDFYKNTYIYITGGTGVGQARFISGYVGATKVATVNSAWVTNPANDSTFAIIPFSTIPGASAPTAADVADAVWDEAQSGHTTAGTFGKFLDIEVSSRGTGTGTALDAAGVRSAVGLASANLDTQLSTIDDFLDTEIAAIKANTDNLPSDPADESLVIAATDAIMARLGAPAGASVSADVAAVKTDTAAVKTKTDKLTFDVNNAVDANVQKINDVAIVGDGSGTPFTV